MTYRWAMLHVHSIGWVLLFARHTFHQIPRCSLNWSNPHVTRHWTDGNDWTNLVEMDVSKEILDERSPPLICLVHAYPCHIYRRSPWKNLITQPCTVRLRYEYQPDLSERSVSPLERDNRNPPLICPWVVDQHHKYHRILWYHLREKVTRSQRISNNLRGKMSATHVFSVNESSWASGITGAEQSRWNHCLPVCEECLGTFAW